MPLKLLLMHGWGLDAAIWRNLTARLGDCDIAIDDRGYFGAPVAPVIDGACVVVAHSFGAMRALMAPPPDMRGLIAINGFDRFTSRDHQPGVARRLIERMADRFGSSPEAVLTEFRQRCGWLEPAPRFDADLLLRDLQSLRDDDATGLSAALSVPVLSLQGAHDVILPEPLRAAVFASAANVTRLTHVEAGHLLPMERPQWCASAIREFVGRPA